MSRTDRGAPPTLEARGGDGSPAAAELAALGPWFHNVHLPGGAQTAPDHPLGDFPRFKWEQIAPCLPSALEGWRVLDVGCNAGFYSLELARRGALVTAIDIEDRYLAQADWVLRRWDLRDRVALRRQSVYALARGDERWDLVWFMGVLYHLRHPLLALELAAEAARRLLVVQSLTLPGARPVRLPADLPYARRRRLADRDWPRAAFVEHRFSGDPTNWWVPDVPCLEAMVRSAGLRVRARPARDALVCEPGDADAVAARRADLAETLGAGSARS